MKYKQRDELVADLRELADLIEAKGVQLPIEVSNYKKYPTVRVTSRYYESMEPSPREQLVKAARVLGFVEKNINAGDYEVRWHTKNNYCALIFETNQENVCTRRVVGTKQVPRRIFVDVPGEYETEEIVEWDCAPLLK